MSEKQHACIQDTLLVDQEEESGSLCSRSVSASPQYFPQDAPAAISRESSDLSGPRLHSPGLRNPDLQRAALSPLDGCGCGEDSRTLSPSYPQVCGNHFRDYGSPSAAQTRDNVDKSLSLASVKQRTRSPRGSGGSVRGRSSTKSSQSRPPTSAGTLPGTTSGGWRCLVVVGVAYNVELSIMALDQ